MYNYHHGIKFEEAGLTDDRPVKFFLRRLVDEQFIRLHYHSSLEVNICRGVDGVIRFEEGERDLRNDCIIVLPPGVPHSYHLRASDGSIEVYHFLIRQLPGAVEAVSELSGAMLLSLPAAGLKVPELVKAFQNPEQSTLSLAGNLMLLVDALKPGSRRLPARTSTARFFLRDVIDYTEANFREKISLDDISGCAGMSKYHFCRLFKDRTGESWTEYLRAVRLAEAVRLLKNGAAVSEAASGSGFESDSYFIRCFRQEYGSTPLTWQKQSERNKL